jgi:hypothetical protein
MMRRLSKSSFSLRSFSRCERGTQLVELAIVLPVILVLFGAAAEFGRFFYTYTTLSKATRSAARYITTGVTEGPAADDKATKLLIYGNSDGEGDPIVSGLGTEHVAITRSGGVPLKPERVTVQIQGFEYQPLFDLGGLVGNDAVSLRVDISPSTTMRFF